MSGIVTLSLVPTRLLITGPASYNTHSIYRSLPTFQDEKGSIPVAVLIWLINVALLLLGLFLILLVLIQRGKGGGLAGAFGGVGGSSPFGSRAGDTFTRITIYVSCFWLILIMVQVVLIQNNAPEAQQAVAGSVR
jgi:protein translocase SecG subunit